MMAFSQTDLKRLVAYTSVSHLGFVLVGLFSWNPLALQDAIMTMICHGLSTGALFILVGGLQERIHPRDLGSMGGLWAVAPRLSGAALFFSLASLGLRRDRGRVSDSAGLLQNQRHDHGGRESRYSRFHFLRTAHGAARPPGPKHARLATLRRATVAMHHAGAKQLPRR